jgi:hypothetical protein
MYTNDFSTIHWDFFVVYPTDEVPITAKENPGLLLTGIRRVGAVVAIWTA